MVQAQHEWVYKGILKLTPSTVSGKLLKEKTDLKNLRIRDCFHKTAVSGPKM